MTLTFDQQQTESARKTQKVDYVLDTKLAKTPFRNTTLICRQIWSGEQAELQVSKVPRYRFIYSKTKKKRQTTTTYDLKQKKTLEVRTSEKSGMNL